MRTLLLLFVFMNLDKLLKTGRCTETQDQVLSLTPRTQEQVDILKNISTQYETALWQPVSSDYIKEETVVHLFVPANSSETVKDLLQKGAITHEVLLANANELIEMQTRNDSTDPRSSSTFYERYHSLEDIYYWINRTQQDNPSIVKAILIGSSYEKRPLYVLKLSLNNTTNKKAMWIDCGIHAREWISPAFCLWFVQYALSFYKINQEITDILDNMDVYILPVMNPDGYQYTWTTNRMWRKNRSLSNRGNCIGVDLNRNFDANWCTEGASADPCSEIYCGGFPESEPESGAVASFLRSHKDSVQIYLSIHSYSQMLLFPYSCTLEEAENHKDLLEMVQEAAQLIRRHYRNTYRYGSGAKTIYLAPGGSDDWAYNRGIKYSFTFELQDRGRYGFLLPPSFISRACNEALLAVKTVALKVIEKTQTSTSPVQTD
ncbi:carboxypeptidase B2 [Cebidichthys violaceus]|uniref:carboxypeptidase B2 n=1 Tax=Cebidichthys violaceus TaxID=271503 RepID=UPI0035CA85E8